MKGPMHDIAARMVTAARLFKASLYCAGALFFALIMLWQTAWFGFNWVVLGLDILWGVCALGYFVKACEIFAASRQPERPDERQRYLDSRMLYNPDRHERRSRRWEDQR
jgi:hypothetical protein